MLQHKSKPMPFCKMCFNCGLLPEMYNSHWTRDMKTGQTLCPVLRDIYCRNCMTKGHTVKYCPQKKSNATPICWLKHGNVLDPLVNQNQSQNQSQKRPEPPTYRILSKTHPESYVDVLTKGPERNRLTRNPSEHAPYAPPYSEEDEDIDHILATLALDNPPPGFGLEMEPDYSRFSYEDEGEFQAQQTNMPGGMFQQPEEDEYEFI